MAHYFIANYRKAFDTTLWTYWLCLDHMITELCLASRNEGKRLVELAKRRQYIHQVTAAAATQTDYVVAGQPVEERPSIAAKATGTVLMLTRRIWDRGPEKMLQL